MKKIVWLVLVGLMICSVSFAAKVKDKEYSAVEEDGKTKLKIDTTITETTQESVTLTMAEMEAGKLVVQQRKAKILAELDAEEAEFDEAIAQGVINEID